ncbi:AMP-binding protein [Lentzea alba]|uniref:AMP-binding protein n=1 Tax=Lentzea alba TaxID=2714351 RepID=UPI0039BEF81E
MARLVHNTLNAFDAFDDRLALIEGDVEFTYRELLAEINRFARALSRHGLKRGDGLGVQSGNRWELLVLKFAAQVLGLRFVAMDPSHVVGGLPFLVQDIDAALILTEDDLGSFASTEDSTEPVAVQALDSDIAQLVYTGGTTGESKAVMLTFEALEFVTASFAARPPYPADTRLIVVTPLAHALGTVGPALMRLGVPLEIHREFEVGSFVDAVKRAGSAAVHFYPSYLYRLLDEAGEIPGLAHVTTGGAPLLPSRYQEAIDRYGPIVAQAYGQFESFAITYLDHGDAADHLTSVGEPVPGVELKIDGGHVLVRSPGTMTGYWRRPNLTAEVLQDGWLRTGDLGSRVDGHLHLAGRAAEVIVVNADTCYVAPIEAALASHPDVAQAAVVGVPDARTGQAIHAVVEPLPGRSPDSDVLRRMVSEQVTPEHVPQHVTFVDRLPLTPLGKPDKKALPRPH